VWGLREGRSGGVGDAVFEGDKVVLSRVDVGL
jgi:hypothetical protein